MKRLLIILIMLPGFLIGVLAQDYEIKGRQIIMTQVIKETGTIKSAHDKLAIYFAKAYDDVWFAVKYDELDHLVYKGTYPDVLLFDMKVGHIDVEHTINIAIRENRIKVTIACDKGLYRDAGDRTEYYLTEFFPITNKSNLWIQRGRAEKAFNTTINRMRYQFVLLEELFRTTADEEDW